MALGKDYTSLSSACYVAIPGEALVTTPYLNCTFQRPMRRNLPIDIHTHKLPTVAGTAIVSVSPQAFHPMPSQWYAVGIHPWDTDKITDLTTEMAQLEQLANHPQVVAIGEVGLDPLHGASIQEQIKVFESQALLAEAIHKPVIIHLVKSVDNLLLSYQHLRPTMPWIIHGFRGKPQLARQLLNKGFYLSFGTHFNLEALCTTPNNRLLIETDEHEADIDQLCQTLALARCQTNEELRQTLDENVKRLFFKP